MGRAHPLDSNYCGKGQEQTTNWTARPSLRANGSRVCAPDGGSATMEKRLEGFSHDEQGGTDLPDRLFRHSCVQPSFEKFSPSRFTQISFITPAVHPTEGRIAIVTDAGLDAMDAGGAADESAGSRTAKSCGPDAPTLASSSRSDPQTTVARKPGHRGELEGNR
jgi:hypothetical protein